MGGIITSRVRLSLALVGAAALIITGLASSASASPFVPRFQINCGSAGTYFSEVNPVPAPVPAPFAPAPEAHLRLLTTSGGETNAVLVLLQVTNLSTGEVVITGPGLEANEANPNLVTCTVNQFELIGLLTPAG